MDGIKYSNTKFLEDHFGWYGVLIEATPHLCDRLQRSGRNRSIKICSGICDKDTMKYGIHKWDAVNGMIDENINDTFNNMLKSDLEIRCDKFKEIFKRNHIEKIDFFSLDVEGAEMITLKTFDWSTPVHYWIVEINRKRQTVDFVREIEQLFFKHNYRICSNITGLNRINTCFYLPKFPKF